MVGMPADLVGMNSDPPGNYANTWSLQCNETGSTLDCLYSLNAAILFPSSSPMFHSCSPLYHHRRTLSYIIPLYLSILWLYVNSKCHLHQPWYTLSTTASTKDWVSSVHYHDYGLPLKLRFQFRGASIHDRLPPACCAWELKNNNIV